VHRPETRFNAEYSEHRMVEILIPAAIVVAIVAGFWFTRNAKGPTQAEMVQKATEANASVGPMGQPMGGWDDDLKPPRDPEVPGSQSHRPSPLVSHL
jgi:hypothetical protein